MHNTKKQKVINGRFWTPQPPFQRAPAAAKNENYCFFCEHQPRRQREKHFLEGKTINSSYAIHQDVNDGFKKCMALGFSMGNKIMFETTIEKEVISDLTGERCILMGLIQAAFSAQYNVLRKHYPL